MKKIIQLIAFAVALLGVQESCAQNKPPRQTNVVTPQDGANKEKENKRKKILIDKHELAEVNAIKEELIAFHDSIKNKKHPIVSVEDGFSAMEVAYGILAKLEKSPIHF